MARERKRGTVRTTYEFLDLLKGAVFPAPGYALPSEITATAELEDGSVVVLELEVTPERALVRTLSVTTDREWGVSARVLASIPTRDIAATAVLDALHVLRPQRGKSYTLDKLGGRADAERSEEVRQIVQKLVGYKPNTAGLVIAS